MLPPVRRIPSIGRVLRRATSGGGFFGTSKKLDRAVARLYRARTARRLTRAFTHSLGRVARRAR